MIHNLILSLCLAIPSVLQAADKPIFAPPLYSFQNGLQSMPVKESVVLLKELGYQGLGSIYPKDLASFKAACDVEGLGIFSIYAGGKVNADSYQIESQVNEAIQLLKGTNTLVELNVQRGTNPNDEQAVALVRDVADKAKESGLKVVLYPHAGFYIERLDFALRIAKATGRDNVGVTFYLYHMLKVQPNDDLDAALFDAKPLLWSASTCGANANGNDWTSLILPLDEGTFDQSSLLRCLRKIGFQGPIGLQCYNIKMDPRQHLNRSHKEWEHSYVRSHTPPFPFQALHRHRRGSSRLHASGEPARIILR